MSNYARQNKKQSGKPMGGGKIALIVLLVLVLAAVIFLVVSYNATLDLIPRAEFTPNSVSDEEIEAIMNYNPDATGVGNTGAITESAESTTEPATLPDKESGKDILNILVVGQPSRSGEASRMADTMILVTVNKETGTLTLTSFLRDAYLKLPDYKDSTGKQHYGGEQRINICYQLGWTWDGTAGAMAMVNQCLYENFGIDVDYNVEINFESFEAIIEMLGGVEIELTEAEAEYLNKDDQYVYYDMHPGVNLLNGTAALSYVRMRKAEGDGESDIKRTSRQRQLMEKILDKIKDMPFSSLQYMVNEILPMITTNMTNDEITACLWEILPLLPELKIETGTCPAETTYYGEVVTIGGAPSSVLRFDAEQNRELMMAITEGTGK